MRKLFKIGQKVYKFKKDALAHYRKILNSYDSDQSLNNTDFTDLNDLIDFSYLNYLTELELNEDDNTDYEYDINEFKQELKLTIKDIKVAKVQFNTKCFQVFYDNNESEYISYIMLVNNQTYNSEVLFNKACRNSIQEDIMNVKQIYFDENSVKGQVKCQETGVLSNVDRFGCDHRQPITFSVIVERFKELNNIDLDKVEFITDENNTIVFNDQNLADHFRKFHKDKASLRIVRKECNTARASLARLKRTGKDLTIK